MSERDLDELIREGAFAGSAPAFRAILDALETAIVLFDRDGLVRMANAAAAGLFAAPPEGLVGLRITDPRYPVLDEDGEPLPLEDYPVSVAMRTGEPVRDAPVGLRLPDGSALWISVTATPLRPEGAERPAAVVATFVDITRYKETEIELARSNFDLSQFASVVAHDLSAPLTVIAGMAEMIRRRAGAALDPSTGVMLDRIAAAARSGQSLIRELLEYAKAGQAELDLAPVALGPLAARVVELLGPEAERRIAASDLPTVEADRTQLRQVLQNLLSNALKFSEGPVRIAAAREPDGWRLTVRDEGIGIAREDHERIFEMLTRTPDADGYPGTGIGLAVCRRIVERHGGRIGVESEPGRGSTFWVTLPGRG